MKKLNFFLVSIIALSFLYSFSNYDEIFPQDNHVGKIRPTPTTHTQVDVNSPILVRLTPPPQGKLGIADLWNVSLTNTSKETYKVYLYGTLTEKKAGLVTTASTSEFDLRPGTKMIKASDFPTQPDVSYPNGNPKYKEALIKTGSLPPGEYTYCVFVIQENNNEQLGFDCLDQTIEDMGMISLMSPGNEEEIDPQKPIVFTWMSTPPQQNANYKFRVVELTEGQSPDVAFKNNNAFFEKTDIKTTTFLYPKLANPFKEGKKYAWGVIQSLTNSEVWTFETGKDSNNIYKMNCRLYMKHDSTGPCDNGGLLCSSQDWPNGGIKANAYIMNNKIIYEFDEMPSISDGIITILYEFPLHPDFSKRFGYERMVLKKGNYKIDFSKSKYGRVEIPVHEMSAAKVMQRNTVFGDKNCDPTAIFAGCDLAKPTPLPSKLYKLVNVLLDDDYMIIEFNDELETKSEKFDISRDIPLDSEICKEYNVKQITLKGGSYYIDYMNSKYGMIAVPIIKQSDTIPTNSCRGNIIQNWSFVKGIQGPMPTGSVSSWTLAYGSPDVSVGQGCDYNNAPLTGFINMWGNKVVGEAIQQTLTTNIISGRTYRIELCAKKGNDSHKPLSVQFEFRASNYSFTVPGCTGGPGICGLMGRTNPISNSATWTQITLPDWVADGNYSIVTISATNSSSLDFGDSTSSGQIDNICIYEVSSTKCQCRGLLTDSVHVTLPNGSILSLNCGNSYSFHPVLPMTTTINLPNYICSPNNSSCQPQYFWSLTGPGLSLSNTGQTINQTYTTYGLYTLNYYVKCGDKICDTCTIPINITEDSCNCGHWNSKSPIKVQTRNGDIKSYSCDGKPHVIINKSTSITSIKVTGYECKPDEKDCQPVYTWEVRRTNGALIKDGTGSEIKYNVDLVGIPLPKKYQVIFYAWCGGEKCKPPCILNVQNKMIWPEWKDDFMEVAERGKFTLNQDFEVYEGNEQVVVVSSLKGIEEYSISDLQKGQDLLFVYTDFNDGNDGYYKIKFTAKDSLNGIIEIIDMDGKVVNSQEAVMKETSTKTNGKDIKITIEKDPGGPCGITWLNNPKGRDLEINFTLIIKNN